MNKDIMIIVDDQEINRDLLKEIFNDSFKILTAEDGQQGIDLINCYKGRIVAVLSDLIMPEVDGFDLLDWMNKNNLINSIPVFVITSADDFDMLNDCYKFGVVDTIAKPFMPEFLKKRILNVIELYKIRAALADVVANQKKELRSQGKRLKEQDEKLLNMNRSIVDMLATVIEFRNCESGEHVKRIRTITVLIFCEYIKVHPDCGITLTDLLNIADASVLHDVGKIAIPDTILCKPGKLTKEEFEIMKTHTIEGCGMLENIPQIFDSDLYSYCYDICRHHHERWDGSGYPDGLKGDEISIWAQVVSIADVYDALVSKRIYKDAYAPKKALEMIFGGECGEFNPELLKCFKAICDVVENFYNGEEVDLRQVAYECYKNIHN